MAAVNPCGFVLLPTYLVYYLGTELHRDESNAATLRRAIGVGTAVSSGFVGLFLVVGLISRLFTKSIEQNAKYVSLVIGVALIAMGIAMFRGWKPPVAQPDISVQRKRTHWNMFLFGIVYAIASIGCTIGFLTSVILGSVGRHGYLSGVISIVLYGLGMGLLVTSLTVTLAFARTGLLATLKRGLPLFDRVSALFVVLTGLYLTWYWLGAITDRRSDGVVSTVENLQTSVVEFLQRVGAVKLGVIFVIIIAIATAVARRTSASNES
jgi:cytochrome c biogenesis protein CcdA